MFIETSAKAGHNVKALFKKIAQALPGMDKPEEAAANQSKLSRSFLLFVHTLTPPLLQ